MEESPVAQRTRLFAEMTWTEVEEAIGRGAGALLPVGSTEQHGYHLPLATDAILATELALAVAEPLDFLVAPAVAYGYRSRPLSGGGQGFVGTTSLQARTLIALVEDILRELIRQGFERIVVLNWHMENQNFVYESAYLTLEHHHDAPARILVAELAFSDLSPGTMELLFPEGFPGWDVEHASILETSLMLHLRPELVLFDRAVDDEAKRHPWYDVLPVPEDFVPASGTLWKATQASADKGKTAWDEIVAQMQAAISQELAQT
jgi:creatinine amidohydrolase